MQTAQKKKENNTNVMVVDKDDLEHILDFADFMSLHVKIDRPHMFKQWVRLKQKTHINDFRNGLFNSNIN